VRAKAAVAQGSATPALVRIGGWAFDDPGVVQPIDCAVFDMMNRSASSGRIFREHGGGDVCSIIGTRCISPQIGAELQ